MNFSWFAETPIVEGYTRNCVYDLPRKKYSLIPKDISELVYSYDGKKIEVIKLNQEEKAWIAFFEKKEYCFYTFKEFSKLFLKINFKFHSPSVLTNSIIDINHKLEDFPFHILEKALCKHLVIRFLELNSVDKIICYLKNNLNKLTFRSITIVINSDKSKKNVDDTFKEINSHLNIITNLIIYHKPISAIRFRPKFIINIESFSESQNANLFFNQKLHFTSLGEIKNSIESSNIIGNLKNIKNLVDLKNLIADKKSELCWDIPKEKIDICRDCEFRFMCLDNRVPLKRNENEYYHLQECSYNPYVCKWDTDAEFLSLDNTGVISNQNEFSINKERLSEINKQMWVD